jgi:hypothetical protein
LVLCAGGVCAESFSTGEFDAPGRPSPGSSNERQKIKVFWFFSSEKNKDPVLSRKTEALGSHFLVFAGVFGCPGWRGAGRMLTGRRGSPMANLEKDIAEEIVRAGGPTAARLGLRFDRVVMSVLGDLRCFVEGMAPPGATVVVAISAPIRRPAKTCGDLKPQLSVLLRAGVTQRDQVAVVHGNAVRMRLLKHPSGRALPLIGFVHTAAVEPACLLDLAERWLGAQG